GSPTRPAPARRPGDAARTPPRDAGHPACRRLPARRPGRLHLGRGRPRRPGDHRRRVGQGRERPPRWPRRGQPGRRPAVAHPRGPGAGARRRRVGGRRRGAVRRALPHPAREPDPRRARHRRRPGARRELARDRRPRL
ncbi:MAG: hypothetical protein AVDCRST_MAG06-399, partial [uncultured Nocardioides sp.]